MSSLVRHAVTAIALGHRVQEFGVVWVCGSCGWDGRIGGWSRGCCTVYARLVPFGRSSYGGSPYRIFSHCGKKPAVLKVPKDILIIIARLTTHGLSLARRAASRRESLDHLRIPYHPKCGSLIFNSSHRRSRIITWVLIIQYQPVRTHA